MTVKNQVVDALPLFKAGGHLLILDAKTKVPMWPEATQTSARGKDWQLNRPGLSILYQYNKPEFMYGLVPYTIGFVVVDVDTDSSLGVDILRQAVVESLGEPAFDVITVSKGLHLYYRCDQGLSNSAWRYEGEKGGEIRSQRGYVALWNIDAVVIGLECMEDHELVDTTKWPLSRQMTVNHREKATNSVVNEDFSEHDIREVLNSIPSAQWEDYDEWIRIGAALHHAGFDWTLWDEFSKRANNYTIGECEKRWPSFATYAGPPVTYRTLLSWAYAGGYVKKSSAKPPPNQSVNGSKPIKSVKEFVAPKVGEEAPEGFLPSTLGMKQKEHDTVIATSVASVSASGKYMHLFSRWWQRSGSSWLPTEDHHVGDALSNASLENFGVVMHISPKREALDRLATLSRPRADDPDVLNPSERAMNFNLDTGAILDGAVFGDHVVSVSSDGRIERRDVNDREFIRQRRPYELPNEHDVDHDMETPLFDNYLTQSFGGPDTAEAELLMQFAGRALVQYMADQKFLVLIGPGGSGKGTFLRLIERIMGREQAAAVSQPQELGKRFQTSKLVGKSILTVGDLAQKPRAGTKRDEYIEGVSIIKNITGQDKVSVESKHQEPYQAVLNLSIMCATNHSPEFLTSGADASAWKRRMLIVSFPSTVSDDGRIEDFDDVMYQKEGANIALRCIIAFAMTRKEGKYADPLRSIQIMDDLIIDAQGIEYRFFTECVIMDPESKVVKTELGKMFEDWGKNNRIEVRRSDKTALYGLLVEKGCEETRPRDALGTKSRPPVITGCKLTEVFFGTG